MKVAIPVKDDSLTFSANAGHTPYFAVYNIKGGGMFKSFELDEVRPNPRTDIDHDHDDSEHVCSHDHGDEEHAKAHYVMGDAISDCAYIVVKMACKNTAAAFTKKGIKIKKYNGEADKANVILSQVSAQLI